MGKFRFETVMLGMLFLCGCSSISTVGSRQPSGFNPMPQPLACQHVGYTPGHSGIPGVGNGSGLGFAHDPRSDKILMYAGPGGGNHSVTICDIITPDDNSVSMALSCHTVVGSQETTSYIFTNENAILTVAGSIYSCVPSVGGRR